MRSSQNLLASAVLLIAACGSSHGGSGEAATSGDSAVADPKGQGGRASPEGGAGTAGLSVAPGDEPEPTSGSGGQPSDPALADAAVPPSSADPCELPPEFGGADRSALDRLGLFGSMAVVEGELRAATDIEGIAYARVALERVWFGWGFLAGTEVLVPMMQETYAELGTGARVILAIGTPGSRPWANVLMTDVPVWEPLLAVVRAEHACSVAPLLGYRPWRAPAVAVVKITAQDEARTTFEVVETIAGELPDSFRENWPVEWGLPYPGVSDDEYIVSVEWFDDTWELGSIVDMRPNDAAQRDEVERALARWQDPGSPERSYLALLDGAAQTALTTRTGWLYNRAALVATLEISGKTPKCCNTNVGVYLAGEVRDVFKGTAPGGPLITFLDGVFTDYACGERFIYALSPVAAVVDDEPAFACDQVSVRIYMGTSSQHTHRMPDTPDNAAAVARWIASEPPLYRLYSAVQAPASELFAATSPTAVWSTPLPPEAALAAGTLVMLTVERVVEHADGHEVVLTTQFSEWPDLEHLTTHELKLFFADGDPRLLEPGRTWLASVASLANNLWTAEQTPAAIAAGEVFLMPSLLLPARDEIRNAASVLRTYPDPGVTVINPP